MIPPEGRKVEITTPETEDNAHERKKLEQELSNRELINPLDPRLIDAEEFEADVTLSVERNLDFRGIADFS